MPPKFDAHKERMTKHYDKHPDIYSGNVQAKTEHFEAEKQLIMTPMPPLLVGNYNELVIMMGWVLFFSVAFPAGSFFCIFASYMTCIIELEGMSYYKKKNMEARSIVMSGKDHEIVNLADKPGVGHKVG